MKIPRTKIMNEACNEAKRWLRSLPADTTPEQAWALCPRGDWLIWYADRAGVDRKTLVRCAVACARLVEHLMPVASREVLDVVERWVRGEATDRDVRAEAASAEAAWASAASARAASAEAAWAAAAAARAAAWTAAEAEAAWTAAAAASAWTAEAAWAAASAASARAASAEAAWAAAAASAEAARAARAVSDMHIRCAVTVRAIIPELPLVSR